MLKIEIISVGKVKTAWVQAGIEHYRKLASKFAVITLTQVKEGNSASLPISKVREEEGQRIIAQLEKDSLSFLLDVNGAKVDSLEFANMIEKASSSGRKLQYIIGGAFGVDLEVTKACKNKLSLSAMTFPHEISQLLLLEQIYRGFSINTGSKYHK